MFRENKFGEAIPWNMKSVRVVVRRKRKKQSVLPRVAALHDAAIERARMEARQEAECAANKATKRAFDNFAESLEREFDEHAAAEEQARLDEERAQAASRARYHAEPDGLTVEGAFVVPWLVVHYGDRHCRPRHESALLSSPNVRGTLSFSTKELVGIATGVSEGLHITVEDHDETIPWDVIFDALDIKRDHDWCRNWLRDGAKNRFRDGACRVVLEA